MNATTVRANGIDIAYEAFGSQDDPPVVLVMGLGTQMIAWPDPFCADLASRGRWVIRFDNRDVGESTHLHGMPTPGYVDVALRRTKPPYTVDEMAGDTIGLVDALGLDRFHLVGASMGGFIAQTVALGHPERIRTLTLMMTSTGSRFVGNPRPSVFWTMLRRRVGTDQASAKAGALEIAEIIRSKGYAFDEDYFSQQFDRAYARNYDFDGYLRQLAAVAAQPDRTEQLRRLTMPALVIHGLHDPLVAPSGGLAVARRLRNAKFVGFSGMGHDLPRALWGPVVDEIAAVTMR